MTAGGHPRPPQFPHPLLIFLMIIMISGAGAAAQECPDSLRGAWHGVLPARQLFEVRLVIHEAPGGGFAAEIMSGGGVEPAPVRTDGGHLKFQSAKLPIAFDGRLSDDGNRIGGFVAHGSVLTYLELAAAPGARPRTWTADWSPLDARGESFTLDLYVGDDDDGRLGGWWFFRDQRLPALWGYGLECAGGLVRLREKNLGLDFEGRLEGAGDALRLSVGGFGEAVPLTLRRMPADAVPDTPDAPEMPAWPRGEMGSLQSAPEAAGDGWPVASPDAVGIEAGPIAAMIASIEKGEMALIHGVLIARHGRLAVEEYFYGFDRETLHDMRSASKTIASTLTGIAIREKRIPGVGAAALTFFPYRRYANWDPRKARITVRDLLRMSSGLDADDSRPGSTASEDAYQSQSRQPDWIKLALDAPMIGDPGAQSLYGGANPLILGGILARSAGEPVEWFAHRTLFGPLGIDAYRLMLDPTGLVYMAGGMHMRPRDMLKYGQLYLNGGLWQGQRILSEEWVRESWGKYGQLAPLDQNGHQYGYLWWHHGYDVDGRWIETLEARGRGGQYIFVVPSLDLVAVVTAGNYRNGKTRQPEEIMRRFVLPAVVQVLNRSTPH